MLHIDSLTYRIGGRVLLENATANFPSGHKVGLVGRNGTGKSTLLRLIMGELEADSGDINLQRDTRVGTVAQQTPEGDRTPRDFVLEADTEYSALLVEAETAEDPDRISAVSYTHLTLPTILRV